MTYQAVTDFVGRIRRDLGGTGCGRTLLMGMLYAISVSAVGGKADWTVGGMTTSRGAISLDDWSGFTI